MNVDGDTTLYLKCSQAVKGRSLGLCDRAAQRSKMASLTCSRVPELAQHCRRLQIRQIQPNGPYLIGGLCAGGVIAFETARQLEQPPNNL